MDKLAVASANVQEIIGTGIIDSLRTLGGNTAVDDLANDMERAALGAADFLRGLSQIGTFKINNETKSLLGLLLTPFQRSLSAGPLGAITRLGAASRIAPKPFTTPMTISGQSQQSTKLTKEQAKVAKETLKISKDQLKLNKAKAIFDIQKIQIEAALKGKISEEERIRLPLQKKTLMTSRSTPRCSTLFKARSKHFKKPWLRFMPWMLAILSFHGKKDLMGLHAPSLKSINNLLN
jgi:hypothetical protein